jgi:tetratricopeptide (TPR) repeat protein
LELSEDNIGVAVEACRRLDGIPLALELAAAQVGSLGLEAAAASLAAHFRRVTGRTLTALSREQTLRAVFDWVYDQLPETAQILVRRIAVFAGGVGFDAAAAVCGLADIAGRGSGDELHAAFAELASASLAWDQPGDGATRWYVQESVRQFGREKLDAAGEAVEVRNRHRDWYVQLAEESEPELRGPRQQGWLARLETEHDNVRTALAWSLQQDGAEAALRLASALWRFWQARGYFVEGRAWLDNALETSGEAAAAVRANALNGAGVLAWRHGDYSAARSRYSDALELYERLDDRAGVTMATNNLGIVARHQGDYELARSLHARSLEIRRALGDEPGMLAAVGNLGSVALVQRDYETARKAYDETLALARKRGDKRVIAGTTTNLAIISRHMGDYATARRLHEECLVIGEELGDRWVIAESLNNLGTVALLVGDHEGASDLLGRGLRSFYELGDREGVATCLERLGTLAVAQGDDLRGGKLSGAVEVMRAALGIAPETPDPAYDRIAQSARQSREFANGRAAGRKLTIGEAIELASG